MRQAGTRLFLAPRLYRSRRTARGFACLILWSAADGSARGRPQAGDTPAPIPMSTSPPRCLASAVADCGGPRKPSERVQLCFGAALTPPATIRCEKRCCAGVHLQPVINERRRGGRGRCPQQWRGWRGPELGGMRRRGWEAGRGESPPLHVHRCGKIPWESSCFDRRLQPRKSG